MTLTEFLTARINEDEAVAREVEEKTRRPEQGLPDYYEHADTSAARIIWDVDYGQGGYTITAARVLAECEAKRAIIEDSWRNEEVVDGEWGSGRKRAELERDRVWPAQLEHLALVYQDHPDYDEAWRP